MGRPMPGYRVALLDPVTGQPADEGEISFDLEAGTVALLTGYHGEPARTARATRGGFFHTGDIGSRDADGYITYVGRDDDVFKASDYRISPFAVESVLLESPGRRRGRGGAVAGSDPAGGAEGLRRAGGRLPPEQGRRPVDLRALPRPSGAVSSGSADWSSARCPRPSPARSAGSNSAVWSRQLHGPGAAQRTTAASSTGSRTSPSSADPGSRADRSSPARLKSSTVVTPVPIGPT